MSASSWTEPAFVYYSTIPPLNFAMTYVQNALARVRPYAAILSDDPDQGPIALTDETAPDGLDPDLADQLIQRLAPFPGYMGDNALKLDISGETFCGLMPDDDSLTGETCRVFSNKEIIATGDGWRIKQAPDDNYGELVQPGTPFWRIWRPDPEYSVLPYSYMIALNGACETYLTGMRLLKSLFLSRLATTGKLLVIADEFSLESAANDFLTGTEDAGDGEAGSDPFFDDFMAMGAAAILDPESANAVMNPVIRGPLDLVKNGISVIDISRTMEDAMMKLRQELREEIATGVDLPRELILGLGATNHWNAEEIKQQAWLNHLEPRAYAILSATTTAYYRPALLANGVDPDIVRRSVIWYDPTWFLGEPDRAESADYAYDNYLISGDAWRDAKNFSADDAPTEDEIDYRVLIKQREQVRTTLRDQGIEEPPTVEPPDTPQPPASAPGNSSVDVPDQPDVTGPETVPQPKQNKPQAAPAGTSAAQATTRTLATNDGDDPPTGVMVALMLPAPEATILAGLMGEDPEETHVTLALLGDAADLTPEQQTALGQIVSYVAGTTAPIDGMTLPGIYEFGQSNDERAVVIKPYLPGVHALHEQIILQCQKVGLPVRTNFANENYVPHITLGYIQPGDAIPNIEVPSIPLHFAAVTVRVASEETSYPFGGTPSKTPRPAAILAASNYVPRSTSVQSSPTPQNGRSLDGLGNRLVAIERDLRTRLLQATDSTVGRALERAGVKVKNKLHSRAAGQTGRAFLAQVQDCAAQDIPSIIGRTAVESFGFNDQELLTGALGDLEARYHTLVKRAQHAALAAVAASVAVKATKTTPANPAPDYDALEEQAAPNRNAGWEILAAGLAGLAAASLYNPHPSEPDVGEYDGTSLVPPGLIRAALDAAGGAQMGSTQQTIRGVEIPSSASPVASQEQVLGSGATGGPSMLDAFNAQMGITADGYVWVYGDSPRKEFPPHSDLDGVPFSSWEDDALSNTSGWPDNPYFFPSDHSGCECSVSIQFVQADETTAFEPGLGVDLPEGEA